MCTSENGSSGCRPEWNTSSWSTSITASVDNRFSTFDLRTVEGLPGDVAYVSYTGGEQQRWQRPVLGFAAFPNVDDGDQIVIAYDDTGNEVGRLQRGSRPALPGKPEQMASNRASVPLAVHHEHRRPFYWANRAAE